MVRSQSADVPRRGGDEPGPVVTASGAGHSTRDRRARRPCRPRSRRRTVSSC